MGNRAVITTSMNMGSDGVGIYLHWNGGRDSVQAFLKYCKMQGYRSPDGDCYGWTCLAGVIFNFFGDGLSCGINRVSNLDMDNWDNGVYIVKDWEIVGRYYLHGEEQMEYELFDMLCNIDKKQPEEIRLGEEKIKNYLEKESAEKNDGTDSES